MVIGDRVKVIAIGGERGVVFNKRNDDRGEAIYTVILDWGKLVTPDGLYYAREFELAVDQ
jgi:hypothetical protein